MPDEKRSARYVCRIWLKGRQGSDHTDHDGHGVRVMFEAFEELNELLMHQGVHGQVSVKGPLFLSCGQVTHQQEVCAVQKVTLLCQLFYVIPAAFVPSIPWLSSENAPYCSSHSLRQSLHIMGS